MVPDMKDIKLFVSVFKDRAETSDSLLLPVSAGAACYGSEDPLLSQRDDEGENISPKNPQCCELTVQYQAWKNRSFDVGGLMHQRRYFDFSRVCPLLRGQKPPKARPYRIFGSPDPEILRRLGYERERVEEITGRFAVLAPLRENLYQTVSAYYDRNDRRGFDDLALLMTILGEKYPEYLPAAEEYLHQSYAYFCNMFVMQREQFHAYSAWLFDILSEYDKRKPPELFYPREQGKLAERLFGVYMTYLVNRTQLPVAELPRAHFAQINGATARNLSFSKSLYVLCPPGSRRRGLLRRIKK